MTATSVDQMSRSVRENGAAASKHWGIPIPWLNRSISLLAFVGFFGAQSLLAGIIGPTPVEMGGLVVGSGYRLLLSGDANVTAYFYGGTSSSPNEAFLFQGLNAPGIPVFCNQAAADWNVAGCKSTVPGTAVDLGFHAANSELAFSMQPLFTPFTFFNGGASSNPDNVIHAFITGYAADTGAPNIPAGVYVSFEDGYGGNDFDYNDISFVLSATSVTGQAPVTINMIADNTTNVSHEVVATPEPSTWILAVGSLGVMGLFAGRRRRQHHL